MLKKIRKPKRPSGELAGTTGPIVGSPRKTSLRFGLTCWEVPAGTTRRGDIRDQHDRAAGDRRVPAPGNDRPSEEPVARPGRTAADSRPDGRGLSLRRPGRR